MIETLLTTCVCIYTTKHEFRISCIQRFSMNVLHSQFHVHSWQCNCIPAALKPSYSPYYGITITSGWLGVQLHALARHPGPSFRSRSALCTGHGECRPIRGQCWRVATNERAGSDPAPGPGNQAGVQGQARPGLSWP